MYYFRDFIGQLLIGTILLVVFTTFFVNSNVQQTSVLPKSITSFKIEDSDSGQDISAINPLSKASSSEYVDFKHYGDQVNTYYFDRIMNHIENFSSFNSRVTGYPGYEKAINYIEKSFRSNNLTNVQTLFYPLLIPYDRETSIMIDGKNYSAHTLAPNSVHICKTPSLSGPVVYGGSGTFSDLDDRKIENSIVVLEFNSHDNWINAVSLGAKAIIFLSPPETDRYEVEFKKIDIPLYIPRIYIDNITVAEIVKELSFEPVNSITLHSDIEWVSIEAKNLMGVLPGLDDDIIIISSYFDSNSIIPSISPGADEACGIATLLELIHLMREENITPQKTIMFLALSGHNQGAAGAREFVFQNYDILNIKGGIQLFISLDLSTANNKIGINPYGYLYKFRLRYTMGNNLYARLKTIGENFLLNYAEPIREATGFSFEVQSYINLDTFEQIAPIVFVGDQEPFIASNVLGLSFFTAEANRLYFNTPFDLVENLQPELLKDQVVYSFCALIQVLNEENLGNYLDLVQKDFSLIQNMYVGFGLIEGHCKEYNKTTGHFSNIPDAIIQIISQDLESGSQSIFSFYTKTDEYGFYQVRGISSSQPNNPLIFIAKAYFFDSEGNLDKISDLGKYGSSFPQSNKLTSKKIIVNPIIFSCGTIGFLGVSHPIDQTPCAQSLQYEIEDPTTDNHLLSYNYLGAKSISLVFIAPNICAKITGRLPDGVIAIYATNSSRNNLHGYGFLVNEGDFKNLGISTFITSKDLLAISQFYINTYLESGIYDKRVFNTFQSATILLNAAIKSMNNYSYSEAIMTISEAQKWSFESFKQSKKIIEGGIASALFFTLLMIPFSIIVALLISHQKQILTGILVYIITFCLFYIINPVFQIIPHLMLTLIALFNLTSIFPIFLYLSQEGYFFLKTKRKEFLGSHFSETDRISTFLIGVKTGISRMKNHKYQTLLSLSSLSLLTFSLTLYISASHLGSESFIELALPIMIAILLMINTSISIIYQSKNEISIFISLGLSPNQIIRLFLTEFFISSIIGIMIGYLGGVAYIRMSSMFGFISDQFSINYSSDVVISTIMLSLLGLFLSILYPLRISGQISVPSQKRTWEFSSLPEEGGTKWNISLPFITSSEAEAEGILNFLFEYFLIFESESVGGGFFLRNIYNKSVQGIKKHLIAKVNLAPFDMGILQIVNIFFLFDAGKKHWTLFIELTRLEGPLNAWVPSVKRFIAEIRNQLLIWRILPIEEKLAKIGNQDNF